MFIAVTLKIPMFQFAEVLREWSSEVAFTRPYLVEDTESVAEIVELVPKFFLVRDSTSSILPSFFDGEEGGKSCYK